MTTGDGRREKFAMHPSTLKLCLALQGIDSVVIGDDTSAQALKLNEIIAREAGERLTFESNPATFLRLLQDSEDFRTA